MLYAPIIIPTLCRAEKLKNCIESLQKNSYARYTELYISLDYPPSEKYMTGYLEVKNYLQKGIEGFANVVILEQTSNQGWSDNYQILKEKVYEKYDCYIYTEDDNVFSPNFLEYMNKNLMKYQMDEDVLAVTGYSYPINWDTEQYNSMMIQSYFAAWGYGIWREKEEKMLQMLTLGNFEKKLYDIKSMKRLYKASRNQYCNFIKGMIGYTDMLLKGEEILKIDLSYALYQLFYDKYMIFPTISKARNMGYGKDGMHCEEIIISEGQKWNHRYYPYDKQPIEKTERFEQTISAPKEMAEQWNTIMGKFFAVSKREIISSVLVQIACKIFGRKTVTIIFGRLRRI